MRNIKTYLYSALCMLALSGCSDFLDTKPLDQFSDADVWTDPALAQSYLNQIYSYMGHGTNETMLSSACDESQFIHGYGLQNVVASDPTQSAIYWYDNGACPFKWRDKYKGLRYVNQFISQIDNVPEKLGFDNKVMKGEALFLRAYMYSQLVRGYGGVPIVEQVYELDQVEDMKIPRNSLKECLDFITTDLDMAAELLPLSHNDKNLGRITKGAALALKARMYLHLASPLFYNQSYPADLQPLLTYEGDQTDMYNKAKAAAQAVFDLGIYNLIDCTQGTTTNWEIGKNFQKIITDKNNSEKILTRQFLANLWTNNAVIQNGPNGYHNWGGNTPIQDLVMDFEYADGTMTKGLREVGSSTTVNPYLNREPRFYGTIGYDGSKWGRDRPADVKNIDPYNELQCGTYEVTENGSKRNFFGVDTRKGPIEDWNGGYTGYYMRKIIDEAVDGQNFAQEVPWNYIRLAEVFLIYAEACIELNQLDAATSKLNELRARIGMPDVKTTLTSRGSAYTQESLRNFLRHERRVELAFEESRYYDIRRWMIAPQVMNQKLTGISVLGQLKPGADGSLPYRYDETKYNYTWTVADFTSRENRNWKDKMYFAPITRDELKRNDKLINNPGYE